MRKDDDDTTMWNKMHDIDSRVNILEVRTADMSENIKNLTTSQINLGTNITELGIHFKDFLDKFSDHLDRTEKNIKSLDEQLDKSFQFQTFMVASWKAASVGGTILILILGAAYELFTHFGVI